MRRREGLRTVEASKASSVWTERGAVAIKHAEKPPQPYIGPTGSESFAGDPLQGLLRRR